MDLESDILNPLGIVTNNQSSLLSNPLLLAAIAREEGAGRPAAASPLAPVESTPDMASYYAALRGAESGGRADAANPNSSAVGLYQFTTGTWNRIMREHPDLGLTPEGRTDPTQNEKAIPVLTAENANGLEKAGIAPSHGNLYAAHFLGLGGATSVLQKSDDTAMSSAVPSAVLEANPFLKNMTVGQFKQWAANKVGGEGAAPTGQLPGEAPANTNDLMPVSGSDSASGSQMVSGKFPAAPGTGSADKNSLLRLLLLSSMANVRLQPVDYNPYAVMPHFQG